MRRGVNRKCGRRKNDADTLANVITNDNGLRASCNTCGRIELLDIPSLVTCYGAGGSSAA